MVGVSAKNACPNSYRHISVFTCLNWDVGEVSPENLYF